MFDDRVAQTINDSFILLLDSIVIRVWPTEELYILFKANYSDEQEWPCKSFTTEGVYFFSCFISGHDKRGEIVYKHEVL